MRNIHLNPVRAGMEAEAAAYPWSGHRTYLRQEVLVCLITDRVVRQFGATAGVARRRNAKYVVAGVGEGQRDDLYRGEHDPRVVGEEGCVASNLPAGAMRPRPPKLSTIVAGVCRADGLTPEQLFAPGRARQPARARAAVAWLAVRSGAATLMELSTVSGRDASTLSHGLTALEKMAVREPKVKVWIEVLRNAVMRA